MSDITAARTKALEEVAVNLRRIRRMADPDYSELQMWRDMAATFRRDLPDCIGTGLEGITRLSVDICGRRVIALEGFAQDGVRETYK